MTNNRQRIFGLDVFRAIAILLVVMSHGSFLLDNTVLDGFPYFHTIDGVDLFFVLSGFLIGSILLNDISSGNSFGLSQVGHFWKRRWFRTLPAYYLVLLANYYVVKEGIIKEDIHQFSKSYFFFLQNFKTPSVGFFWESWSLAVEEWFYLLAPIILVLLLKRFTPKQSFLYATLLLLVLPLVFRWRAINPGIDDFWFDVTFRKVVIFRLDSIAFGLLAAWLFRYYPEKWKTARWTSAIIGILLMIFIVRYKVPAGAAYKQTLYFTLTPLSAALLLPLVQQLRSANGFLARTITHISSISYSMYLINLALVAEVIRDNFPPVSEFDSLVKYGGYWVLVIVGATFLYRYFEKPVMDLRDR